MSELVLTDRERKAVQVALADVRRFNETRRQVLPGAIGMDIDPTRGEFNLINIAVALQAEGVGVEEVKFDFTKKPPVVEFVPRPLDLPEGVYNRLRANSIVSKVMKDLGGTTKVGYR